MRCLEHYDDIADEDFRGEGSGAGVAARATVVANARPLDLGAASGANALLSGTQWTAAPGPDGRTVITYAFSGATSVFATAYGAGGFPSTAQWLSEADRALVREVLATIEEVCSLRFVEVQETGGTSATLRYAYSQGPNSMGFAGFSFFPSESAQAGDIWLGQQQAGQQWGFYLPNLILHETLHALGLKHPFEGPNAMSAADDIIPNTVMSYSPLVGYPGGALSEYPAEPMLADVQALQALYGASDHNAGNNWYRIDQPEWRQGFHVLWDAGGKDVLDASAMPNGVSLDLAAGARSDLGWQVFAVGKQASGAMTTGVYRQTFALAHGTSIEFAIGTEFDDSLWGNGLDNILIGGSGADRLFARAGDDWLGGGPGNDRIDGGEGLDTVVYGGVAADYAIAASGTSHTVRVKATGETDTLAGVERLLFEDGFVALVGVA